MIVVLCQTNISESEENKREKTKQTKKTNKNMPAHQSLFFLSFWYESWWSEVGQEVREREHKKIIVKKKQCCK